MAKLELRIIPKELGSATPADVEDLAACGASGSRKGNVWRDMRSKAKGSTDAGHNYLVLLLIGLFAMLSNTFEVLTITHIRIWACCQWIPSASPS